MEPRRIQRTRSFQEELARRRREHRFRQTEEILPDPEPPYRLQDGRRFLDFCSNDYLGLACDPDVVRGAVEAVERYGAGSTASRLIAGTLPLHEELEEELARFTGREAALLFNSGFQANASLLPALGGRKGLILCDRRSHHSILQGALGSRAELLRFRHNDVDHLEFLLERHGGSGRDPALIVTESVFSMGGDRAPLEAICRVADRHDALLFVDDAHAVGVWGDRGEGLAAGHERIDLVLGTFGKAFGGAGAFVACSASLRAYLVNACGGFVYTTAPPPATVGAARAALAKIASGSMDRAGLHRRIAGTHRALGAAGFPTDPSDTQIVPIGMEDEAHALACAEFLRGRGILTVAIRPPTVPSGSSRIRVTLNRHHTEEHVTRLVTCLQRYRESEGCTGPR